MAYGDRDTAWLPLCAEFAGLLGTVTADELRAAILESATWVWSDPERARRASLEKATEQVIAAGAARVHPGRPWPAGFRMPSRTRPATRWPETRLLELSELRPIYPKHILREPVTRRENRPRGAQRQV